MVDAIDTLKTAGVGVGGWWLTGMLPEIVSLCVGLATLTYLIIKLVKEIRDWKLF